MSMSSSAANVEKLNEAITTLSEDADDIHQLIMRSTDELNKATDIGNQSVENASKIVNVLEPLAKQFSDQMVSSSKLLKTHIKETKADREDFAKKAEKVFEDFGNEHKERFEEFRAQSLKESQKTRDDLQNDFLAHKTASASRFENLEGEVTKLTQSIETANKETVELVNGIAKKLIMPGFVVVALGAINLICLVLLLSR